MSICWSRKIILGAGDLSNDFPAPGLPVVVGKHDGHGPPLVVGLSARVLAVDEIDPARSGYGGSRPGAHVFPRFRVDSLLQKASGFCPAPAVVEAVGKNGPLGKSPFEGAHGPQCAKSPVLAPENVKVFVPVVRRVPFAGGDVNDIVGPGPVQFLPQEAFLEMRRLHDVYTAQVHKNSRVQQAIDGLSS